MASAAWTPPRRLVARLLTAEWRLQMLERPPLACPWRVPERMPLPDADVDADLPLPEMMSLLLLAALCQPELIPLVPECLVVILVASSWAPAWAL